MATYNKKYILIDESGDPDFYGNRKKLLVGTPGFQPYLILGMIETTYTCHNAGITPFTDFSKLFAKHWNHLAALL